MEQNERILTGHTDLEKGAYLGAIASIATADRQADEEEIEHLEQLSDAAELSPQQKEFVVRAATELTGEDLNRCLDVLKNSELRYSLVTDLIAFAKSDGEYHEAEKRNIEKIAAYLGVGEKQFSILDRITDKASETKATPEEAAKPSFLSSLGMNDQLQQSGINSSSLFKGLIGIAGPMILGSLLSGGMRRRGGLGGGMMGGGFGGGMMGGGGLGSIIGMLSGGRGFGSTGGLFGRILGGGRF